MIDTVASRINRRLQAVGKSARAASLEAGLSEDAIRNIERAARTQPRRGVSTNTITALAPVLGTSVAWLMGDSDIESPDTTSGLVPVVGYVSLGAVAVIDNGLEGALNMIAAPEGSTAQTVALRVVGDSMGPLFTNWLVFWDDVREAPTANLMGEVCVIGLPDGQILVRQIRPAADGRYHLISSHEAPLLDQEVVWAARVTAMRPG